jgi:hypothetical protein
MQIWDDFVGFFILITLFALICSSIFWGIASGALAINAKSKRPLLHIALGALLHFVWFFVVGILAISALAKRKANPNDNSQSLVISSNPANTDLNKGFEEW